MWCKEHAPAFACVHALKSVGFRDLNHSTSTRPKKSADILLPKGVEPLFFRHKSFRHGRHLSTTIQYHITTSHYITPCSIHCVRSHASPKPQNTPPQPQNTYVPKKGLHPSPTPQKRARTSSPIVSSPSPPRELLSQKNRYLVPPLPVSLPSVCGKHGIDIKTET
jgi:hypothetical protein